MMHTKYFPMESQIALVYPKDKKKAMKSWLDKDHINVVMLVFNPILCHSYFCSRSLIIVICNPILH